MVKIIENYVLERVIGKGQFGQVYKGYHKVTKMDIAIKSVSRKQLKGKFYELLENEIKVLKCCNNNNIIKLYDIKKTANNIYLMIEYCNEGDLYQHLKYRKVGIRFYKSAGEVMKEIFRRRGSGVFRSDS